MTNNEKIIAGFDSGIGGLSALAPFFLKSSALKLGHQLNYLADLANLPYGSKSKSRLTQLTRANIEYLMDETQNPKPEMLIIACNTVSAFALDVAKEICDSKGIPCVGVIEASCREAIKYNPQRILTLSTKATAASGVYPSSLKKMGYDNEVLSIPCPLFVPFVEEGIVDGPAVSWIIQKYLSSVVRPNDLVILACTHYPYLLKALQKEFPFLNFIQAGEALLKQKEIELLLKGNASPKAGPLHLFPPQLQLQFTDNPDETGKLQRFLNELHLKSNFEVNVRNIAPLI